MKNFEETKFFEKIKFEREDIDKILRDVISIIEQKGYDPINQIMGYIKTEDPIYIPRDNQCREKIRLIDKDDILEYLLYFFIKENEC